MLGLIGSEILNDWLNCEDLLIEFSVEVWLVRLREDFLLEVFNESVEVEEVVIVSNDLKGN